MSNCQAISLALTASAYQPIVMVLATHFVGGATAHALTATSGRKSGGLGFSAFGVDLDSFASRAS